MCNKKDSMPVDTALPSSLFASKIKSMFAIMFANMFDKQQTRMLAAS